MASEALRIGDLVRETGKTARTLHFYEELGLLEPARRTTGGFREYAPHAVVRVLWIERLQDLGFSLPEVGGFLAGLNDEAHGPAAMERLRAFYQDRLVATRAQLAKLRVLEQDLVASVEYLDGCRACDPLTARGRCSVCDAAVHEGRPAPPMVVAVTEGPDATSSPPTG